MKQLVVGLKGEKVQTNHASIDQAKAFQDMINAAVKEGFEAAAKGLKTNANDAERNDLIGKIVKAGVLTEGAAAGASTDALRELASNAVLMSGLPFIGGAAPGSFVTHTQSALKSDDEGVRVPDKVCFLNHSDTSGAVGSFLENLKAAGADK